MKFQPIWVQINNLAPEKPQVNKLTQIRYLPIGSKFIIPKAVEKHRGIITLTGMANGCFHSGKWKKGPLRKMYLALPSELEVLPVFIKNPLSLEPSAVV